MKPTIIGSTPSRETAVARSSTPVLPIDTGAIVLTPAQTATAVEGLANLDFATMRSSEIVKIGLDAEQALQRTLDGFLARLDQNTAAQVFALFGRLEKGVEDANLPEILEKVQNGEKPGVIGSLLARFRGKRPDQLAEELLAAVGALISGRTKTLADQMAKLEGELSTEMQKLFGELQALDGLKNSYRVHFDEFTIAAGVARALLDKARKKVEEEGAALNPSDPVAQGRILELKNKLGLLESRALALEGTYTRLPADQMVIQQIEQAGIATLQETATTVASRFASIKMTLLSIHGAFAVKSVQQMAGRQAKLDRQLTELRGRALNDVAVTAALAPGENRVAQAQQIERIIASTKEIHELVAAAKRTTSENFELARQKFLTARQDLVALSST